MTWSKTRQLLEETLYPGLKGILLYDVTGYRYMPDKSGMNYIIVDKKKIFNMKDITTTIKWYQGEQEIKKDDNIKLPISQAEIEALRIENKGMVPDERLIVIARNKKMIDFAKEIFKAQSILSRSDFKVTANKYLSSSIDESLFSNDILLNILAIVDKRVGKKRLIKIAEYIKMKHPIVQYFYNLRCSL